MIVMKQKLIPKFGEIIKKDIHIGDTVIIRRAGDVIPEIVKVVKKDNLRKKIKLVAEIII